MQRRTHNKIFLPLVLGLLTFLLSSGSARAQTTAPYEDLHDFGGTVTNANGNSGPDGKSTYEAGVAFDKAGNMYGTTVGGGANGGDSGMVWEITTSGAYYDLHDFGGTVTNANGENGPDGVEPNGGVSFDSVGNMYGTAYGGGANPGGGMVWEITTSGAYHDLHDFGGTVTNANGESGPDGDTVQAGITFNSAGNMYGTTTFGGANNWGMVWEIAASGAYYDLHDFGGTVTNANGTSGPDGTYVEAGITFDSAGNMYGTASSGGPSSSSGGLVWEIATSGTYYDLHDFQVGTITNANGGTGSDGAAPEAGVTFDSAGNMYGTARVGGLYSFEGPGGMAWEIAASGAYHDLHDFGGTITNANGTSGPDGVQPAGGVTFDSSGNMYGTTDGGGAGGMVWELTKSGIYKDLHDFGGTATYANGTSGPDGKAPYDSVTFDPSGNMYGTTTFGGANGSGMVWALQAPESITSLGLSPTAVVGGFTSIGTVTLAHGAPVGGWTVNLASQFPTSVGVPASVTVPAGQTSATFNITTLLYSKTYTDYIEASESNSVNSVKSAQLTVLNPLTLTLSATTVTGGTSLTGTVTLPQAAVGNVTVTLGSQYSTSVVVPASVTVLSGQTSATFNITTLIYPEAYTNYVEATLSGATQSVKLTVLGDLAGLTLSPSTVLGGTDSTGTVTLAVPAPAGGIKVTLGSQYPTSVGVPASVTIPAGKTSATFNITTLHYSSGYTNYIEASYSGAVQTAKLTVTS